MTANEFCIFCEIVAGRADASAFYEDDRVLAFLDLFPINPGHALVIPKTHAANLSELDAEDGKRVFAIAQRVADALRKSGVRCEGVNLFLADGEVAGQEVFHVHMHVIPRYEGDGFGLRIANKDMAERGELEDTARRIRDALSAGAAATGRGGCGTSCPRA